MPRKKPRLRPFLAEARELAKAKQLPVCSEVIDTVEKFAMDLEDWIKTLDTAAMASGVKSNVSVPDLIENIFRLMASLKYCKRSYGGHVVTMPEKAEGA